MDCPSCERGNREDAAAQGHTVGLAQRMEALAESGHICLSEHTARLVEGYFVLQDLGRTGVKGVSEPVGLFDLEGVGSFRTRLDRSRARGLSTFVGRDRDMAARLAERRLVDPRNPRHDPAEQRVAECLADHRAARDHPRPHQGQPILH